MAIAELPIASTGEICAPAVVTAAAPAVRLYFVALSLLSLGAFDFGVENRFIFDGLTRVPPSQQALADIVLTDPDVSGMT